MGRLGQRSEERSPAQQVRRSHRPSPSPTINTSASTTINTTLPIIIWYLPFCRIALIIVVRSFFRCAVGPQLLIVGPRATSPPIVVYVVFCSSSLARLDSLSLFLFLILILPPDTWYMIPGTWYVYWPICFSSLLLSHLIFPCLVPCAVSPVSHPLDPRPGAAVTHRYRHQPPHEQPKTPAIVVSGFVNLRRGPRDGSTRRIHHTRRHSRPTSGWGG